MDFLIQQAAWTELWGEVLWEAGNDFPKLTGVMAGAAETGQGARILVMGHALDWLHGAMGGGVLGLVGARVRLGDSASGWGAALLVLLAGMGQMEGTGPLSVLGPCLALSISVFFARSLMDAVRGAERLFRGLAVGSLGLGLVLACAALARWPAAEGLAHGGLLAIWLFLFAYCLPIAVRGQVFAWAWGGIFLALAALSGLGVARQSARPEGATALMWDLAQALVASVVLFILVARLVERARLGAQEHRRALTLLEAQSARLQRMASRSSRPRETAAPEGVSAPRPTRALVSHEFRTPLAVLGTNLDLIDLHPAAPDLGRPLGRMRKALHRLTDLVNGAVDLDGGAALPCRCADRTVVSLARVMSEALSLVTLTAPERRILLTDTAPGATVWGYDVWLYTAFSNLLENALKYSPEDRPIHVGLDLSEDGRCVMVRIQDSGIGIPPACLPLVFRPSFRAPNARTLPGTGMGLSIARDLIKRHGGEIAIVSEVDRGTTVEVTLPCGTWTPECALGEEMA